MGSDRLRKLAAVLALLAVALVLAFTRLDFSKGSIASADERQASTRSSGRLPTVPVRGCDMTFEVGSESWPDCSDTGVPVGTPLTPRSGILNITENGTTIDHVYLTGSVDIYADNVTIEDSVIISSGYIAVMQRPGYHGLELLHDTIMGDPGRGPDSGGEGIGVWNIGGSAEIGYDNISDFGGDVDIITGEVFDSYLHNEQAFGSEGIDGCNPLPNPIPQRCYNHSDAFGIDSGHDITLRHNTILESSIPGASSAIKLNDDLGKISDVTVIDNFISGGSYCTYSGSRPGAPPSVGIKYIANAFSTLYEPECGKFGPVAYWNSSGAGSVWSRNYWVGGPHNGRSVN
jgi:hypothetical protein